MTANIDKNRSYGPAIIIEFYSEWPTVDRYGAPTRQLKMVSRLVEAAAIIAQRSTNGSASYITISPEVAQILNKIDKVKKSKNKNF